MRINGYLFKIYWNKPFLYNVVELIIVLDWFNNKGKFKVGDRVRVNWKAIVSIRSAIEDNIGKALTVSEVSPNGSHVSFKEGSGCDAFWIRKIYWFEN